MKQKTGKWYRKINEAKSRFFEKKEIDKSLAKLTKNRTEDTNYQKLGKKARHHYRPYRY